MKYNENTLPQEVVECDCRKCEHKATCVHDGCYRRLPKVIGGLGLCRNLKK